MEPDEAIKIANSVVLSKIGRPLSNLERHVLRESIAGKSYEKMADGWSAKTLKDSGSRLWRWLSQALGDNVKVNKSNFQAALIQLSLHSSHNSISVPENQTSSVKIFPSSHNPFGDRGRIDDPKRFFDREELLRKVFEGLRQGCSQSLVGEPQIGKSSILSAICFQGPAQLPSHKFVWLDMQCVHDENDFFSALCQELDINITCRGFKLNRKLRGKRYILCLDEIEKMTNSGDFSGRERTELRGLADGTNSPLTLVIVSRSPLSQLFPDTPETTSPLAGICNQLNVEPFPPSIAQAFIKHRLQATDIVFTETQIGDIVTKSKGHPARLQEHAAQLYRQLSEHKSSYG